MRGEKIGGWRLSEGDEWKLKGGDESMWLHSWESPSEITIRSNKEWMDGKEVRG